MDLFHAVPTTILVGAPASGKSFSAKVAAAMVSQHTATGVVKQTTAAALDKKISKELFFIINDPKESEVEIVTDTVMKVFSCIMFNVAYKINFKTLIR